jgi:hypothetical protein
MSALGLQRVLGLGSYQTAWAWLHKLRRAMALPGRELLCGVIEVDESCRGASSRGRWPPAGRQGRDRRGGRHRARAGADQTDLGRDRDTLTGFVLDNVARGSEVRTDAWTGYDDIGRFHFSHVVTNMSAAATPPTSRCPTCISSRRCSNVWILGTHQGSISHHQLDYYLDEFTFRFNRRRARHRGLLFYRLLEGAIATHPRPYMILIDRFAA